MGYEDLALVVFVLVIPKPHPQASQDISSFWEDLCPTDSKNKTEKGRCRTLREQDMGLLTRKPREEFGHI